MPPTPGTQHGVILDLFLDTSDKFQWVMSPVADGANWDSPQTNNLYVTVTNIGGTAVPITVSFTYIPQES